MKTSFSGLSKLLAEAECYIAYYGDEFIF